MPEPHPLDYRAQLRRRGLSRRLQIAAGLLSLLLCLVLLILVALRLLIDPPMRETPLIVPVAPLVDDVKLTCESSQKRERS